MGKPFTVKNPYPVNRKGGINPNSEGNTDVQGGRSGSSAFQYKSPAKTPITDEDPHTHPHPDSKVKGEGDKDITNRGDFNEEITKGIDAGTTKVYQKPDGTIYTSTGV